MKSMGGGKRGGLMGRAAQMMAWGHANALEEEIAEMQKKLGAGGFPRRAAAFPKRRRKNCSRPSPLCRGLAAKVF